VARSQRECISKDSTEEVSICGKHPSIRAYHT
jgi:hypothetical protein